MTRLFEHENPFDTHDMTRRLYAMNAGSLRAGIYQVRDGRTLDWGRKEYHLTWNGYIMAMVGEKSVRFLETALFVYENPPDPGQFPPDFQDVSRYYSNSDDHTAVSYERDWQRVTFCLTRKNKADDPEDVTEDEFNEEPMVFVYEYGRLCAKLGLSSAKMLVDLGKPIDKQPDSE